MVRYFVNLTVSVFLLALMMNAQAQIQEKQADKPAAPTAQNPFGAFQRFSATLNGGMGRDTNRKMYRLGNLMRFDFADHHRVVDLQTRSLVLVYPDKCSKVPMMDPGVFPFSRKFRVESSTVAEAKETVDGHVCKVEDVVLADEGPISSTFKMRLYEAEDLNGFPVKVNVENPQTSAKFTINYSEVSLQPPDPKLFEHPGKCDSPTMKPLTQQQAKPKAAKPAAKAPPKPAPKSD